MEKKVKASDLSKLFGFPSKEIVKILHDYNVSAKNYMSALTEYELDVIFEYYTQKNPVADFSMYDPKASKVKEETTETNTAEDDMPMEEIEIVRKTRTVDTRVNTVDLDRLDDEKIEELIPENIRDNSSNKKQKINQKKKQQGKPQGGRQKHQNNNCLLYTSRCV